MDICVVIGLRDGGEVVVGWCGGAGASRAGTPGWEVLALLEATDDPKQDGHSQDRDDEADRLIPRKAASMENWEES